MTSREERERFIIKATALGINYPTATKLLRAATTLARLSEAQCNGDWPADNGERKVSFCVKCEAGWAPSVLLKGGQCPDCRAEDRVRKLLKDEAVGLEADFQSSLYGIKLRKPGQPEGEEEALFVPSRS